VNDTVKLQLQEQIKTLDSISTAPAILKPLLEMLRLPSDEIKVEKVVELVSYDAAIAGQCLRMANSPLYGRRQTATVRTAVMALGIERVRTLLLGLCLNHVIPPEKWVMEPNTFWRHSLGCALVTQKMAKGIEYHDPEKAYLAGLIHDLGLLVNSVLYTAQFRECVSRAATERAPLHAIEQEILGFTHCDSGYILSEHWGLPAELGNCISCHHDVNLLAAAGPLACLVHLSDLLCRTRYLGYGYEETMGVELGGDVAWGALTLSYPALAKMDVVRFTLDIDGAMDEIVATVDSVFGAKKIATPASA
jgi:HD-like signal output (HDOD) protein